MTTPTKTSMAIVFILMSTSTLRAAENASVIFAKAEAYERYGFYERASKYLKRALELEPNNAKFLNEYAWLLATARDPDVHDGAMAVKCARAAYLLAENRDDQAMYADTLAAAYARKGVPNFAFDYQQRALSVFRENDKWKSEVKKAEKRLNHYLKGKAWENEYAMIDMEPVVIPRSLYEKQRREVENLLANEQVLATSVPASIFIWHNTNIRPPRSFFGTPSQVVAPLEYIVVSDEEYKDHHLGELLVILQAAERHQDLLEMSNEMKNIAREDHYALIGELAIGVSKRRSAEIREMCQRDERLGLFSGSVWKNFEATTQEVTGEVYAIASK
jgi:tetratricopeptide (TPR) repeat protein